MLETVRARPMIAAGLLIIGVLVLASIAAPWITSANPARMNVMARLSPPSLAHPFGTDEFGRDVFARVLYAGRISFAVGLLVTFFACLLGTVAGILAGYFRRLDAPISRVIEALMAFPDILLAIALMAAFGPSLVNVVLALSLVYAPRVARVVRAATLVLKPLPFVDAAVAIGGSNTRILARHLFPNLVPPLLVQATFVFAYSMLSEAALSFLGAGVPPETPTFGTMIAFGQAFIGRADWMMIFPGIAIALSVMALQLVGDGLRDALDPVLSRAR
jgi:peptide/nickel transport system permease protein